ncbi:alpha/beta-hydrolase [Clavulina sp. PMI_390]|nr:alpha/beta-hydrolase [Clavulina sp. PMI_390]
MSIFEIPGWKTGQSGTETYHYLSVNPTTNDKKTFVFIHGAPTGVLPFRKVVPLLMEEGNGIVVVEPLGFGGSSRPKEVEKYSPLLMANAVEDILSFEAVEKAVIVGHGWGVPTAVRFALKYPKRTEGLILISIPFMPHHAKPLEVEGINAMFKPLLGYGPLGFLSFMASDAALKLLPDHAESFVRLFYDNSSSLANAHTFYDTDALESNLKVDLMPPVPSWASEQEMQEIVNFFKAQDVEAILNHYKFLLYHFDKDDEDLPNRLSAPFLFIECKGDPMIPPPIVQTQPGLCDNITIKAFNGGHWVMEEEPANFITAVKEWIATKLV